MGEMSRRGILGVAAAATGIVGVLRSNTDAAAAPTAVIPRFAGKLVLDVDGLQTVGGDQKAAPGRQHLVTGSVTTRSRHPETGVLSAQVTRSGRHDLLATSGRTVESHLLELPGGTIVGAGTVGPDGTGDFAVTGGTGTYSGVHGSYRFQRSPGSRISGSGVITLILLP